MYGLPTPDQHTFKEGDRVRINKSKSTFHGMTGAFFRYENAHLCRIRLDEQGSDNPLYSTGLVFFTREIEPID